MRRTHKVRWIILSETPIWESRIILGLRSCGTFRRAAALDGAWGT